MADLGVDPDSTGRCLFEATDFLLRRRRFDPASALVLLQVGAIGLTVYREGTEPNRRGLATLAEVLADHFPADHPLALYQSAQLPLFDPLVHRLLLADLPGAPATFYTTLYVPPRS